MPIYAYACKSCEHTLDALQKMSDDVLVDCPECGEASLKRQLSAPRFRLKGSGWYETDFKTENKRNLAGDDGKPKSDAGKADAKDQQSGDGKAAAKPAKSKDAGKDSSPA
ncbi:MAG: zinc ribbon domain-containing protein [Pseudomonadota bacterium]